MCLCNGVIWASGNHRTGGIDNDAWVNNGCLTEDGTVTHSTQTEIEIPAVSSQLALTYSPTQSVVDSGSPSENGDEEADADVVRRSPSD